MTQKIGFTKSGENKAFWILNIDETKIGWKEIDKLFATFGFNPKHQWIFRVKVEPFEFSLNEEKKKVETIDFFVNNDIHLHFFLGNALKNDSNFELQQIKKQVGKAMGFSENRSDTLVVYSNLLKNGGNKEEHEKIRGNSVIRDLEIDWKNITLLDYGLSFDLTSSLTISLNNHNFTYDKIFLPLDFPSDYFKLIKKRLSEWKENNKPVVIKDAVLSTKSWLSVKNSNILYIVDTDDGPDGQEIEGLTEEFLAERVLKHKISGWEKLPYQKRKKFLDRFPTESVEHMRNEIEVAIRTLENNDDQNESGDNNFVASSPQPPLQNPNQNNKNSSKTIPLIMVTIGAVALLFSSIFWKKSNKNQKRIKNVSSTYYSRRNQ